MDFLSKLLQRKSPKSGGGGSSPAASTTPVVDSKPDHEANVQFAREFIVELVETVPKKSEKAALAKRTEKVDKEDIVSLKSVSPSISSFQSVSSVTENSSLPDLLQPESVYKKQTDTDTDTTEYESAAETDPLDATSPIGSLIAEDLLASFQEALDKKYPPASTEPTRNAVEETVQITSSSVPEVHKSASTDNSVSLGSDPSPLSDAYEDAGDVIIKTEFEEIEVKPLDISGLCLCVNNLCLDSPKKPEEKEPVANDSSFEQKAIADVSSNSDISLPVSDVSIKLTDICAQTLDQSNTVTDSEGISTDGVEGNVCNTEVLHLSEVVDQTDNFKTNEVIETSDLNLSFISDSVLSLNDSTSEQGVKAEEEQSEIQFKAGDGQLTDILHATGDSTQVDSLNRENIVHIEKELSPCKSLSEITGIFKENLVLTETSCIDTEIGIEQQVLEEIVSNVSDAKNSSVLKDDSSIPVETEKDVPNEYLISHTEKEQLLSDGNSFNEWESVKNQELKDSFTDDKLGNLPSSVPEVREQSPSENNYSSALDSGEKEQVVNESVVYIKEKPLSEDSSLKSEIVNESESVNKTQKQDQVTTDICEDLGTVDTTDIKTNDLEFSKISINDGLSINDNSAIKEVSLDKSVIDSTKVKDSDIDFAHVTSVSPVNFKECVSKADEVSLADKNKNTEVLTSAKETSYNTSKVDTSFTSTSAEGEADSSLFKEPPTVLSELFEICNRQQKDLELGDEKFVDGRAFFGSPSTCANLNETTVLDGPSKCDDTNFEENDLDQPSLDSFAEFDQSITEEAEKILQDIINSSSEIDETSLKTSEGRRSSGSTHKTGSPSRTEVMAGVTNNSTATDENGMNPFISQSALRRSPPPLSGKSPRTASPAESPRPKSKLSSVRDSSSPRDQGGENSPRSRSGKNSPDRRVISNKVGSVESSPKNSINAEINQSEAGPEIADDAHLQGGDAMFKDPAAFDYLNSVGNTHTASDLRKESLYVKFDPLVGNISRTTDKSVPLPPYVEANSTTTGSVNSSPVKEHQHLGNITPEKNPAISVIDKLISLSPSPMKSRPKSPISQPIVSPVKEVVSPPVKQEQPIPQVVNEAIMEELYLLREVIATQDEKYRDDVKKHREQLASLEQELAMARKHLESSRALVKESEERESKLNKKVAEKAQGQKQMSIIMEEYEKTISRLVAEKEQERQAHELDRSSLLKDRDAAMGHLANIEIAFSDLHKKYERSKTVIEGFKKNEEVLRSSLADYEATIRKQEQKYDVLKSHAMAQLENANQELDALRRSQQAEAAKLKAMLKKAEIKTSSLEEMLEQKVKENQELASICDELISKVGGSE